MPTNPPDPGSARQTPFSPLARGRRRRKTAIRPPVRDRLRLSRNPSPTPPETSPSGNRRHARSADYPSLGASAPRRYRGNEIAVNGPGGMCVDDHDRPTSAMRRSRFPPAIFLRSSCCQRRARSASPRCWDPDAESTNRRGTAPSQIGGPGRPGPGSSSGCGSPETDWDSDPGADNTSDCHRRACGRSLRRSPKVRVLLADSGDRRPGRLQCARPTAADAAPRAIRAVRRDILRPTESCAWRGTARTSRTLAAMNDWSKAVHDPRSAISGTIVAAANKASSPRMASRSSRFPSHAPYANPGCATRRLGEFRNAATPLSRRRFLRPSRKTAPAAGLSSS